ncbi:hypothetical protein [Hansschlegelia zhihuaiae]|nr:hypothetical protein [Hansschlegelia zhihuaiae]
MQSAEHADRSAARQRSFSVSMGFAAWAEEPSPTLFDVLNQQGF